MIHLTSMNQQAFYLNSALIYRIEAAPDTVITLVDGKTLMVCESPEQVAALVMAFQREVHSGAPSVAAPNQEMD